MLLELLTLALAAILLLAHTGLLGLALLSAAGLVRQATTPGNNPCLIAFFAISLGLGIDIFSLFLLGLSGLLQLGYVLLVGSLLTLVALLVLVPARSSLQAGVGIGDGQWLAVPGFFALVLLAAYHPPGWWDDTMYQLPLARHYIQHHSLDFHEYVRFGLFPQNINLLMSLGLMWGGTLLAQVFVTLPLLVLALGLMGFTQAFMDRWQWGALAGLLLFLLEPVLETLGYAYVDNGLALFCFAAIAATALWQQYRHHPGAENWLWVAGLLAGTAAGSKLFGGVLAAMLGVYLLFASRKFHLIAIFCLVTFVTGAGWYLRSFIISGDPIHPAGGAWFGHFLWDAADLASQQREQGTHGVTRNPLYLFSALWQAGAGILVLALASLFCRRPPAFIRCMQILFFGYLAFWFFVTQVDRYLAPIYGAGLLLSVYTLHRLHRFVCALLPAKSSIKKPGFLLAAAAAVILATLGGILYQYRHKDITASIERRLMIYLSDHHRQRWLQRRPGYSLFQAADDAIPQFGPRLMQIGFENAIYFFTGTTIGDWYGPGRYRERLACTPQGCLPLPPEAMQAQMRAFNSRMLAISTQRYPRFDPDTYAHHFDIIARSEYGVLFALKNTPGEPAHEPD